MKTMIGKMTCEQARLFIKEAKESVVINPELRNYILGIQSAAPAQLKDKLLAWRAVNLCSNTSPSNLCKIIDIAISNS
jgi:hypothetical protein